MPGKEESEELNKNIKIVKEEIKETTEELEKEIAKLKDPTVHAAIMYTAVRERENTNRILKNIYARIEALETKIKKLEATLPLAPEKPAMDVSMLPETDQKIIKFIKDHESASAEQIQKIFKYKGRNAACARLNRLYTQGFLEKKRVGKTVMYVSK